MHERISYSKVPPPREPGSAHSDEKTVVFKQSKPNRIGDADRSNGAIKISHGAFRGFSDVDGSSHPRSYIEYLDESNANERMQLSKGHLIHALDLKRGDQVLDLGCGVGHDTQMLVRLVGRAGRVVGIDKSKTMIREARRRSRQLNRSLEFRVGDAHHLPFKRETFNGCVSFSTLIHLEQPSEVLTEIARVLKPSGRFIALEPDWDTLVVSTGDAETDGTLPFLLRQSVRHSGIAHQLPILLSQTGFENVIVRAATLTICNYAFANEAWRIERNIEHARRTGALSSSAADHLLSKLSVPEYNDRFFGAFTVLAVLGTKRRDACQC